MSGRTLPFIGIPCCFRSTDERSFHAVNERYPNAVVEAAGCLPLLIPAIGPKLDPGALLDRLDGLLITGSPSNVEPWQYGGPPSREGTLHDPDRDATTLPMIREAVRRGWFRCRTGSIARFPANLQGRSPDRRFAGR